MQESEDNALYLRFYTNSRFPAQGFSAKARVGVCGGTRFIGRGNR